MKVEGVQAVGSHIMAMANPELVDLRIAVAASGEPTAEILASTNRPCSTAVWLRVLQGELSALEEASGTREVEQMDDEEAECLQDLVERWRSGKRLKPVEKRRVKDFMQEVEHFIPNRPKDVDDGDCISASVNLCEHYLLWVEGGDQRVAKLSFSFNVEAAGAW